MTSSETDAETPQAEDAKPFFVVESGNPTAEDIAALTLVLAAATSGGDAEAAPAPRAWSAPVRRMRTIGHPGVGGWRAEYHPR